MTLRTVNQNVFVGISIQNKGLEQEDFVKIVECAKTKFNYNKLVFLVADEIELINQRVFTKGHEKTLIKHVEEKAIELESMIFSACNETELKTARIQICRWVDILDSAYWNCFFEIQRLFIGNTLFHGDVMYAIREYARRRKKTFSNAEEHYLCRYVLHEMPTLLYGIHVNGKHYNSMIYPAPEKASIDRICSNLVNEKYGMILLDPPFCNIYKYKIPLDE